MSNIKMDFANSLWELGDFPKIGNSCERFGITYGCQTYCPVLMKGQCKIEDNEELYRDCLYEFEELEGEELELKIKFWKENIVEK